MATKTPIKKSKKTNAIPPRFPAPHPVFKFPPTPTKDFIVVYAGPDFLWADPVDFVAVCEWSADGEMCEGICFIVLENCGGLGFFDILYPDNMHDCSNRLGVVKKDQLYWYDEATKTQKPIYQWDNIRAVHYHPIEGTISAE